MSKIKNLLTEDERTKLYAEIDKIPSQDREWDKVDVLVKSSSYLSFVLQATGKSNETIIEFLRDYQRDTEFRKQFLPNLLEVGNMPNAGDLRFHAITLYVVLRSVKPNYVIETGVAQGKSSATLLLALHHNNKGKLYSIDLPNPEGRKLDDGAFTSTGSRPVGWMVPQFLRKRWELVLGDAKVELPKVLGKIDGNVDVFFHDSLHTYEHVRFEIGSVASRMKNGVIIVDNLETEAGDFFAEFCTAKNASHWAFSNLGIIRL